LTAAPAQKPLLAANWKMNPITAADAAELVKELLPVAAENPAVDVVFCPPFPWLLGVAELLEGSDVQLGAQNCYWEKSGAFTGEVSADMLAGWCSWVIVGHSERRNLFGESDQDVARKAAAALGAGLQVIVCVGELDEHKNTGQTERIVHEQVSGSLAECAADDSPRLVIAYEPVWAIGSGQNADPEHAYRTMRVIRSAAGELLGAGAARRIRVLYGGSVNAANVESYVELPMCDGCLVGGASLKAGEFAQMIRTTADVYSPREVRASRGDQ
jgi:triosephosphate isomerase